ncbi:hypothetical protein V8F06_003143 [Rhypophila decipiens]
MFLSTKSAALAAVTLLASVTSAIDLVVKPSGGNVSSPYMYGLMHEVSFASAAASQMSKSPCQLLTMFFPQTGHQQLGRRRHLRRTGAQPRLPGQQGVPLQPGGMVGHQQRHQAHADQALDAALQRAALLHERGRRQVLGQEARLLQRRLLGHGRQAPEIHWILLRPGRDQEGCQVHCFAAVWTYGRCVWQCRGQVQAGRQGQPKGQRLGAALFYPRAQGCCAQQQQHFCHRV